MNEWSSRIKGVVDGHVHMRAGADEASMLMIRKATGIEKMALLPSKTRRQGQDLLRRSS